MSLVPLLTNLARELDSEYHHFDHLLEDDFGFGLHPMELFQRPRSMYLHHHHSKPRRYATPYERSHLLHHHLMPKSVGGHIRLTPRETSGGASALLPKFGKDGFQVCMDVSQFKPNELNVKVVDKTVIVEGKHEEREDEHGIIQRHFVRKYTLPKDYDPNEVVSTISSDGVLTLKAPPPPNKALAQKERIVQIQQTGPAHLSVKAPEVGKDAATDGENGSAEKMETGK